jgi:replicative DNA helicase
VTPRRKASPPDEDRELPKNLDAERSVLGTLLLSNEVYPKVASVLRPASFFRKGHQQLYASLVRLLDRPGGAADLLTVREDLQQRGELDEVGGPAYITALIDGIPRGMNVTHYATIVQEKALLRAVIALSGSLQRRAYAAEDPPAEILRDADRAIVDLAHGTEDGRMRRLEPERLLADLDYRHQHKGELTGITSGFAGIDQMTSGWQGGDLIVLAARPSIGKTALAVNMAMAAAAIGKRPAIFSFEMRTRQLEYRIVATLSGVPLQRLLGGYVFDQEWPAVSDAFEQMGRLSIIVDDTAGRSARDVRASCRRLRADGGIDLAIVDYFQLTSADTPRRDATRNEELTDSSRRYKALAGELDMPVILLSQLSRAADGQRPRLSDLRDCGALEQDADVVAFLHRKNHQEGGPTKCILDKQRNGPTGTVMLTFDRDLTRFTDGGEEPAEEPERPRQQKFFPRRAHAG